MSILSTTLKSQWPFSPQSIPGLSLWLDAADTSSITLSGSNVTAWRDKSGNGGATTGYVGTPSMSNINNVPAISFNSSSYLYGPTTNTNSTLTCYVVATMETATPDNAGLFTLGRSGYNDYNDSQSFAAFTKVPVSSGTNGIYSAHPGSAGGSYYNSSFVFTGSSGVPFLIEQMVDGTSVIMYLNGSTVGSVTNPQTSPFGYTTYVVGSRYSGSPGPSSYSWNGLIGEILLFSTALTSSQAQQVEGYLAQKWGLQSLLPTTHPYYANPGSSGTNPLTSPTQISGLKLWLDGADPAGTGTAPSNGSTITTWVDKSGVGNNGTANTPVTWNANGLSTGYPGLTFTNTQWFLGNISITGSTITVFGVISMSASSPFAARMIALAAPNANDYNNPAYVGILRQSYNNMGPYRNGNYPSVTFSYNAPTLLSTWYDGANANISANGALTPSSSVSSGNFTISSYAVAANTNLGDIGAASFYGYMSELIVYNFSLSTSQRQQVEGYLAQKWGLQGSLPPTHPYATKSKTQLYKRPVFQRTFSPVDISGCSLWLDAADQQSIVLSGSTVSQWTDKSGAGRNVTQSTSGLQPTYSSSLKALVFNANAYLNIPDALNSILPTYTIFVVERRSSANVMFFIGEHDVGQSNIGLILGYNATNISHHTTAYITDCQVTIPSYAGASEPVRINRYDYSGSIRDTVINGGQYSTYQSFSSTLPVWTNANIGSGFLTSTYSYIGNIYEIIFYNNVLTNSQAQQVESYLAWKWGLVSSLGTGHPGKLLPSFSTVFTPKSISGCALWLDGADSTSITLSGSNVTAWADKSGNGYSAVPNSGTVTQTKLNSNNVMNFGTAVMRADNFVWASSFTQIFVGYVATGDIIIDTIAGAYGDYVYTGNGTLFDINTYSTNSVVLAVNDTVPGSVIPKNTWFMFCIGYGSTGTAAINYTINGTARSTTVYSGSGGSATNPPLPLYIGGNPGAFGTGVQFAELIHFNSAVSTSQRQQVEGYLAWKWGLVGNLPSTHAYKKISP